MDTGIELSIARMACLTTLKDQLRAGYFENEPRADQKELRGAYIVLDNALKAAIVAEAKTMIQEVAVDSDVKAIDAGVEYLIGLATQKYVNNINLTVQTEALVITNSIEEKEGTDFDKMCDEIASRISKDR